MESLDIISLEELSTHKSYLIRERLEAQETAPDRDAFLSEVHSLVDVLGN